MVCWWVVSERIGGRWALFVEFAGARLFWELTFASGEKVNAIGFAYYG